jgi:hypothetical protein
MNGTNNYQDRNSVANLAEFLFEEYCNEKGYFFRRLGFDEKKDPIPNFFAINPMVRNLPDYYIYREADGHNLSFLVMVKGTANIKQSEYKLLPHFVEWYDSKGCSLIYAFCFKGEKKPLLVYPEKLIQLYTESQDKTWHDGIIYRTLNLNGNHTR